MYAQNMRHSTGYRFMSKGNVQDLPKQLAEYISCFH